MTLKNNRAPLLIIIKLSASFHNHMWIRTRVTVRKRLSWVLTSVTLTFDLWPWTFAWTSILSLVITPENFMMMGTWWKRCEGRTDGRTDWTSHIAAWSQLKITGHLFYITPSFVHHLKPLGEFKLELLSGNAQFGSKSAIFCPVWPWNLMDDLEKQ